MDAFYIDSIGDAVWLQCGDAQNLNSCDNEIVFDSSDHSLASIDQLHVVAQQDGSPWIAFTGQEQDNSHHLYIIRCSDGNGEVRSLSELSWSS